MRRKSLVSQKSSTIHHINDTTAYLWRFIICHGPTDGMDVPLFLKLLAISVDGAKKKFLNEPQVVPILNIKPVTPFTPNKKALPSASKLSSNFNPQALDP